MPLETMVKWKSDKLFKVSDFMQVIKSTYAWMNLLFIISLI